LEETGEVDLNLLNNLQSFCTGSYREIETEMVVQLTTQITECMQSQNLDSTLNDRFRRINSGHFNFLQEDSGHLNLNFEVENKY